jgi:hypothetical protein
LSDAEANMLVFAERFAALPARVCELQQAAAAELLGTTPSSNSSSSIISSGSSSSSTSPSPGVLRLLLEARFARVIGKHFVAAGRVYVGGLVRAVEANATHEITDICNRFLVGFTDDQGVSKGGAVSDLMVMCAARVTSMWPLLHRVQLPGAPVSEAACEAARQQLQQQLAEVAEITLAYNCVFAEAKKVGQLHVSGGSEQLVTQLQRVGKGLPSLGQQLVLFAEAVCAQLSVALCCNNPNCQELRGATEQRLLPAESVCPGCKWGTAPELHSKLPTECRCQLAFSSHFKAQSLEILVASGVSKAA